MSKTAYQSSKAIPGYFVKVAFEKMRNRNGGEYLVSMGPVHFLAVFDDFGTLLGPWDAERILAAQPTPPATAGINRRANCTRQPKKK